MTVYLVEVGAYDDRYIGGVYASVEAAMKAHPVPDQLPDRGPYVSPRTYVRRAGGWQPEFGGWHNGLTDDYSADITAYKVQV